MSKLIAPFDDRLQPRSLWPAPRTALAVLLFVSIVLPTIGTWLYFDVFAGNKVMGVVYSGTKAVQLALPLVVFFFIERRAVHWISRRGSLHRDLAAGAIFGGVVGVAMFALYYFWLAESSVLEGMPAMITAKIQDFGISNPFLFLVFALFISVVHSLLEEYYFRWFIFRRLQAFVPVWLAIALSALAFMGHHVIVLLTFIPASPGLAWFFSLCIAVGGGVWAWMYHRSGSLRGVWLSHFLVDCAIMWLGYEMVDWASIAALPT